MISADEYRKQSSLGQILAALILHSTKLLFTVPGFFYLVQRAFRSVDRNIVSFDISIFEQDTLDKTDYAI